MSSIRSVSPRVPTVENARSRRSAAKSSQAARNSRLSAPRCSSASRRQAGSTLRNVYLTKWRSGTPSKDTRPVLRTARVGMPEPEPSVRSFRMRRDAGRASSPRIRGRTPAGCTRHIEALAGELLAAGHDVRVLAPFDHDDRRTALLHRGTRPQRRDRCRTGWSRSAARSAGPSNGAVSNLAGTPVGDRDAAARAARRAVRRRPRARAGRADDRLGRADVGRRAAGRHVPLLLGERAAARRSPTLMGARRKLNRLAVRIAVSEAAAWTGRRFYGGEYRVVPNGVALPDGGAPRRARARAGRAAGDRLRRPGRRAQGPPDPAARVRGAARARARRG